MCLSLQNLFFTLQDDTILSLLLSCMMSLLCLSQVQFGNMLYYGSEIGAMFMSIHRVKRFSQKVFPLLMLLVVVLVGEGLVQKKFEQVGQVK